MAPRASREVRSCLARGNPERAVHDFHEVPFLFQDEALRLRKREVLAALRVFPQPRLVGFVGGEAVECDQAPADIVGALPRQEIADQVPAAAGNDAPPVFGVFAERVTVGGIDFVTDDADDAHVAAPVHGGRRGKGGSRGGIDEGTDRGRRRDARRRERSRARKEHAARVARGPFRPGRVRFFKVFVRFHGGSMTRPVPACFAYNGSMDVVRNDAPIADVAAAIAEPARARMLCRLLDGHARTGTELSIVAGVGASTTSAHLARLVAQGLVKVAAQGRHRYYSLASAHVAAALEALTVVAGAPRAPFMPNTPGRLRSARTCYDHMAGALAVALHDRMFALRWLSHAPARGDAAYEVTKTGSTALIELGVDVAAARAARRRFACGCLDWSERRPHLAGALGAALLELSLQRKWVVRDLDSRALSVTAKGNRDLRTSFGVEIRP